jgi:hypothetical protein
MSLLSAEVGLARAGLGPLSLLLAVRSMPVAQMSQASLLALRRGPKGKITFDVHPLFQVAQIWKRIQLGLFVFPR